MKRQTREEEGIDGRTDGGKGRGETVNRGRGKTIGRARGKERKNNRHKEKKGEEK